jgi:hypothetical protein
MAHAQLETARRAPRCGVPALLAPNAGEGRRQTPGHWTARVSLIDPQESISSSLRMSSIALSPRCLHRALLSTGPPVPRGPSTPPGPVNFFWQYKWRVILFILSQATGPRRTGWYAELTRQGSPDPWTLDTLLGLISRSGELQIAQKVVHSLSPWLLHRTLLSTVPQHLVDHPRRRGRSTSSINTRGRGYYSLPSHGETPASARPWCR